MTAAAPPAGGAVRASRRQRLALAVGARFYWCRAGMLVRLVAEPTSWHIFFYRSLGVAAMLAGMIAVGHGRRSAQAILRAGWPAVLAGAFSSASSVLFILALGRVTVANALFM